MSRKTANAILRTQYGCGTKPILVIGAPMGMADIAEVLWNDFLKHNPTDPTLV